MTREVLLHGSPIMERYILPSVVNRGLHRLVTGSLGFGNLLPPQAICLGTVPQSEQIREVAELLSHELKIPLSDGLLKK